MRRVAVVDDHRVVADLLAMVLQDQPDLELVGRATSSRECLARAPGWAADVVVMDVRLGDGDGIALAAELARRDPRLCVIVLTAHVAGDVLRRATAARACVLLPKDGDLAAVLDAVRSVDPGRRGRIDVHPALTRQLVEPEEAASSPPSLTGHEQQLLRMVAAGMDVHQISRETGTTLDACRCDLDRVLTTLQARDRMEAVEKAIRHGLLAAVTR